MRILKKIILVFAIIIVGLLVIGLFTKKEYTVVKVVTINKPKQQVFDYVSHLKNQQYSNTWAMKDPNARHEEKGTDGTVGFIYSWESESNEVGAGVQGRSKCFMSTESESENKTK